MSLKYEMLCNVKKAIYNLFKICCLMDLQHKLNSETIMKPKTINEITAKEHKNIKLLFWPKNIGINQF